MNKILSQAELPADETLIALIVSGDKSINFDGVDIKVKATYARYVMFSNIDLLAKVGIKNLSPAEIFYNAYYWMVAFSKRYQDNYGSDAGIDQQVFKVLESAPAGVDWKVVEEIAGKAS